MQTSFHRASAACRHGYIFVKWSCEQSKPQLRKKRRIHEVCATRTTHRCVRSGKQELYFIRGQVQQRLSSSPHLQPNLSAARSQAHHQPLSDPLPRLSLIPHPEYLYFSPFLVHHLCSSTRSVCSRTARSSIAHQLYKNYTRHQAMCAYCSPDSANVVEARKEAEKETTSSRWMRRVSLWYFIARL